MEEILAVTLIFGGGTLFALSMSPIGRAIADRIRGTPKHGLLDDEALEQLREAQMAIVEEVDALRQDVAEVNERVDFAERLLTKNKDGGALPDRAGP